MLRALRKTPGQVAVAILSISLGIGATTAVFSVVDAVLIHPYPYPAAGRMIRLNDLVSSGTFLAWQKLEVFEGLFATDFYNMSLTGGDLPDSVKAARMSANAFEVLGIPALIGREFTSAGRDLSAPPERVVVLSYGFWQDHYGGDPGVLGRSIQLDRENYTVIGVVPPRFQWKSCEVFLPAGLSFYTQASLGIDGRLKPGATLDQANSQALATIRALHPELPANFRVRFTRLLDTVQATRDTLLLFVVAVFALLAVGCANVSILLLARGAARRQELAVRAALGASRRRLIRELLAESAVLAASGAVCGVLLAYGGLAMLVRWLPSGTFPAEVDIRLNLPVLFVTVAVTAVTGILAGLAPAWRFSAPRLTDAIQAQSQRTTPGAGSRRAQDALVSAQVALTVVLLAGAGAAIHTLLNLYHTELGYDPANLLTVTVPTLEGENPTYETRKAFYERIRAQVASLPEVRFAALSGFNPPFYGSAQPIEISGEPRKPDQRTIAQFVSADYFSAFGIPVLRGRAWSEAENARHANVALINQAMADKYWPQGNAIGRQFRMYTLRGGQFVLVAPGSADWMEVIGITGNIRNRGLKDPPVPAAYFPFTHSIGDNWSLTVKTRSPPMGLLRAVREQIHIAAPGQPIGPGARTGEDVLRSIGWAREEVVSSLFTGFAGLALVLAAVGLYSAISYAAVLRGREFGIRIALGAKRADVFRLVLIPAARIVGIGMAAGGALSFAASQALAHWTTVKSADPWALLAVIGLLALVAGIAAALPAGRAAAADPMTALRNE